MAKFNLVVMPQSWLKQLPKCTYKLTKLYNKETKTDTDMSIRKMSRRQTQTYPQFNNSDFYIKETKEKAYFKFTVYEGMFSFGVLIDGSEEDGSYGRLLNDDHVKPNCRPKILDINGQPQVWFFSVAELTKDTELLYNYGSGSEYPWRCKKSKKDPEKITTDKNFLPFTSDTLCELLTEKKPVLIFSGLTDDEQKSVKELKDFGLVEDVRESFSSDVTHLIIQSFKKEVENRRMCPRIMKFFQAILNKCWVLDKQWVYDSIDAGVLLPEENYEICGDTASQKIHNGPFNSRTSNSRGLFTGYSMVLCARMIELILMSGGNIYDISKTAIEKTVCICGFEDIRSLAAEELQSFADYFETYTCVTYLWFIDSISMFQIQPVKQYQIDLDIMPCENGPQSDIRFCENSTELDTCIRSCGNDPESDIGAEGSYINACLDEVNENSSICDNQEVIADDDSEDMSYHPSCSDSDESSMSEEDYVRNDSKYVDKSSEECENDESMIFPVLSQSFENKITFQIAGTNSKGNLSNKLHSCVYCGKLLSNIARHLSLRHHSEQEVTKILLLPKKSKERRKLWEELVNKGDFCHNYNVIENGHGMIIPKYRLGGNKEAQLKNYVPCSSCKAYYKKDDLWKHQKYCVLRESKNSNEHIKNGRLLLPAKSIDKNFSNKILLNMRDDSIKLIVQKDRRIVDYGSRLLSKQGSEHNKLHYISQKLREIARLLICVKSKSDIDLDDLLSAKHWDLLIKSVKTVCEYDEEQCSFNVPSLALKLGHSLKKCARYKISEAIKENDNRKKQETENFLALYKEEWKDEISALALTSLEDKKYNKQQLLPLVTDVVKFNTYLKERASFLTEQIKDNIALYPELAIICLAQVILFTRRRSGEAERIRIDQYKETLRRGSGEPDPVVMSTLNEFEKNLCKSHLRVEIKGKRGRKVPVLFTNEMKKNIDVLCASREKANVKQPYLFSKPGDSKFPYRGSDCLRILAKKSGIENPSALTSTRLRKQLATMAHFLNLSETSQDILATFQGHDIRVHRQFYRLPENASQVAKVTKILHSLNNGMIASFKGKDFDEIEFKAENETIESEIDSSDTETENYSDINENTSDQVESDLKRKTPQRENPEKEKGKKNNTKLPERHNWTTEEKDALKRQFFKIINLGKLPGKMDILNAMKKEPCLANFPWTKLKFAVKNMITSRNRSALLKKKN
ncbi:hypothetical protein KUTeg_017269 [Tegillarca granosa]|uniref:BRCT domain-containing protein n=1 Tax=Tegillarca granosa TaxID=220873 RepID=A0ABQ9EIW3_TEGGR|nr:hypothetical protein KUTeg_017269 [Tegillarca granosa]